MKLKDIDKMLRAKLEIIDKNKKSCVMDWIWSKLEDEDDNDETNLNEKQIIEILVFQLLEDVVSYTQDDDERENKIDDLYNQCEINFEQIKKKIDDLSMY